MEAVLHRRFFMNECLSSDVRILFPVRDVI